ncbi:SAM-dependent methyltransferase [Nocardia sp. CDC159]|uniref:S-adenosyl-L-methionine-dependent methyltransferase n=1 Tax=Nocardia pulmonis TaxID=2951408 RepID=A0A9X2IV61_9NOCA|nr:MULTISPECIES: SAM-dependent methyltransferase [Nocardia]MCM6772104.1 SAM-dependent methyltransferase [Nocardia pulmonis]MCM6785238.1 SAM-dependent methyltransferase [Nocardia sp. CDC159]
MSASIPEILSGAPLTAVGVAVVRARETARPDRLYADPLAQEFVDAAEAGYTAPDAPPGAAELWANALALADAVYESRTLGVRLVDDELRAAAEAGFEQVVSLGAGLDTYAFRLELPDSLRLFEVDLPGLFEFKEVVLAAAEAEPCCERIVVPADLRADWSAALLDKGFRPEVPTTWIDHVVGFLPRADARREIVTVTELSAPASRYGFPVIGGDGFAAVVRAAPGADRIFPAPSAPSVETGPGPDAREWLESLGWRTDFRELAEAVAAYGRAVPDSIPPGTGNVVAERVMPR